jgi:hypothetical protein
MKRILLALFVLSSLAMQTSQVDESNAPESEKRIPQGHYCKRPDVTIGPREARAHHCDCKFSCSVDEEGNIVEHEAPNCLAYCHLNGRRCTCHTEEPCEGEGKHGNALMNMAGEVVAVKR